MKKFLQLLAALICFALCVDAQAATRSKADNTDNMNLASSWVGGLPGSGDIAQFDSTLTVARTAKIAAVQSWAGIKVTNPGGKFTSSSTALSLTLGTSGIDMKVATQDFDWQSQVILGGAQTWNVASSRTLSLGGSTVELVANTLTVAGGGKVEIFSTLSGTAGLTKYGSGTLLVKKTLTPANTLTGTLTIYGGKIIFDTSSKNTVSVAVTSVLDMRGGELNKLGGNIIQEFASTSLSFGNSITLDSGGVLRLNGITRNTGGTVNFGAASIADGDGTIVVNGIVDPAYATIAATGWAVKANGANGAFTALSTYETSLAPADWATTENVSLNANPSASIGTLSINSLRLTAASTVQIDSGATLTLTSGGLLLTGSGAKSISPASGTATLLGAASKDLIVHQYSSGALTIGAIIADNTAATALTKSGPGILILSGANTYTGKTYYNGGTVRITARNNLANNTAAEHRMAGGKLSVGGNVTLASTEFLVFDADGTVGSSTLDVDSGYTLTVDAVVSGAGNFTKAGLGTVKLTAVNTYTGDTIVNAGTLTLDYAAVSSRITDTSVLVLGGGTVTLAGGGSAHNEVVASTTIAPGASSITQSSSTSVLRLNAMSRMVGGAVDFGAGSIADTDTLNVNGILGGYATVAGAGWAINSAGAGDGAITALGTYEESNVPANWALGENVKLSTAASTTTGNREINSLILNGTASVDPGSANILTITSGGILANSSSATTIGAGGTLVGAKSADLIVRNSGSGILSITCVIANNTAATAFTKVGSGMVILTGINTFTGGFGIFGGKIQAKSMLNGSNSSIGNSTGAIIIGGGGTLGAVPGTGGTSSIDPMARPIRLASGGGTFDWSAATTGTAINFTGGVTSDPADQPLTLRGTSVGTVATTAINIGNGSFTKEDAGTWTISVAGNTVGDLTVNGGTLNVNNTLTCRSITVNSSAAMTTAAAGVLTCNGPITVNGGTLTLNSANTCGPLSVESGIVVLLNQNSAYSSGATVKSGAQMQASITAGNQTIALPLTLNGDGPGSGGALRLMTVGANYVLNWSGAITLNSSSKVYNENTSDSSRYINLSGGITLNGNTLTVSGGRIDVGNILDSGDLTFKVSSSKTHYLNGTAPNVSTVTIGSVSGTGNVKLGNNDRIGDGATVNFTGSTLDMVTYTDTVNAIQFNGVGKAKGTWGSSSSAANHKNDTYFASATGVLTVTTGGSSTTSVARTVGTSPCNYGASLTFTATVTGSSGDGTVPSGTVTFYDGVTSLGTGTYVGGSGTVATWTLTTTTLPAGSHSITASYAGNDSYDVSDSSASPVSQTVNGVPTANAVSDSTSEDTAKTITLSGSDLETCDLTFSIVAGPSHGTLGTIANNSCASGSPNTDSATVLYTPAANYNGPDSFTYKVNDGSVDSTTVTVTLTVTAVNDTFYSQGNLDPSLTSSWGTTPLPGSGGTQPPNFTSGDTFVIQNGHNMTAASWSIAGSGSKLWIQNGGTLTAGTAVTLAAASTFQIDDGGTYVHNNNSGFASTIFAGTESFAANSTVILNNSSSTGPSGVAFGNLTINFTSDPGASVNCQGGLTTVNGNLSIISTSTREFRLSGGTAYTLALGGDLNVQGGTLDFATAAAAAVVNVAGNVSVTGGTLTWSGSGSANVNFAKTGTQTFTSGGTISGGTIGWTVNSGSTVDFGTSVLSGSGTFTLSSGGGLKTAHASGIDGNITVTGTKDFGTTGNFTYNGSVAQVTGSLLPSTVNNLTIANTAAAVSLSGDVTATAATTIQNLATLNLNSRTLGGPVTVSSGGTLSGNGTASGVVTVASGGTVSPGASIGTLTLGDAPSLGGTVAMEINKAAGPTLTADKVNVTSGVLVYGGTLTVTELAGSATLSGGEVFDLFDSTGGFNASSSFSTLNLPTLPTQTPALNWYTGSLTNNGTIIVNRAPSASNVGRDRNWGLPLKIKISQLLTDGSVSDPDSGDGDAASFQSVANGTYGTVTTDGTYIYYTPTANNNDTVVYTVQDNRGGSKTANINITVVNSQPTSEAKSIVASGGQVTIVFQAIHGFHYEVQRSTASDFTPPESVTVIDGDEVPDANARITVVDMPGTGTFYYRLKWLGN